MPGSKILARLALPALSALALAGGGCSARTIVAVDPYPCGDGATAGCTADLLNDLIGYWRLNDAPGSTTARDYSVWGNDGTLVGLDPATAWVARGPEGGALSPQGMGYVNVRPSASIDSITTQVTLAAWIYLTGPVGMGTYATAISRQIGGTVEQHYHLSVNEQKQAILFITTKGAGDAGSDAGSEQKYVIGGPPTVPMQTWVHLAGTYDGSHLRLYVNGVQVASMPGNGPFAAETNPVVLSGNGNNEPRTVSEFVPGQLDEVMLYRRALAPDEIARLESGALLPSGAFHPDAGP